MSKLNLRTSPRLLHIVGLLKGDGTCFIQKQFRDNKYVGNRYVLAFESKDKVLAQLLRDELKQIGLNAWLYSQNSTGFSKAKIWRVVVNNKKFLNWYYALSLKDIQIMASCDGRGIGFVKGFYEAEGSYQLINRVTKRKREIYPEYRVYFTNTNEELLSLNRELILNFHFNPTFIYHCKGGPYNKKPIYRFGLFRNKEVMNFIQLIDPIIKNKPREYKYEPI